MLSKAVKYITPGSYNHPEPNMSLLPIANSGRVDSCYIKKASVAPQLSVSLDSVKAKPGQILVMVAPVLESERYGANTNGDAFSRDECIKNHNSFVTYGTLFKEHTYDKGAPRYGKIIMSGYNERVGRIEIIVAIDDTKASEALRGALLSNNREVDWSMGCTIEYDVCSICGNKATTPKGNCDRPVDEPSPGHCSHVKNGMMRLTEDGRRIFVHNIGTKWFDLSWVGTPAEVAAKSLVLKAASLAMSLPSMDLLLPRNASEYSDIPMSDRLSLQRKQAAVAKLAEMEKTVPADVKLLSPVVKRENNQSETAAADLAGIAASIGGTKAASTVLQELTAKGLLLTPSEFASVVAPAFVKEAATFDTLYLFRQLSDDKRLTDIMYNGSFDHTCHITPLDLAVKSAAATFGNTAGKSHVELAVAAMSYKKSATRKPYKELDDDGKIFARKYASYLLSFCTAPHDEGKRAVRTNMVASRCIAD